VVHGIDFDKLSFIIDIEGQVINETPLRIGAGKGEELGSADLPIYRIAGTPVIPGSSLKGVFRSFLERLARMQNLFVCDPFSRKDKEIEDKKGPCIVCQIFGGGGIEKNKVASHVIVFDSEATDYRIGFMTRASIDRFRNAARSGALYRVEFVEPKAKWNFKMRIYNIDIVEREPIRDVEDENYVIKVDLLRNLLKIFACNGLQVGGMKSIGYGFLKLLAEETIIKKYVLEGTLKESKCIKLKELLG